MNLNRALILLTVLSPLGLADTIHLTDGTAIEGCSIENETLTEVTYKADGKGKDKTVPSDQVLKVEFEKLPAEIDRAKEALKEGLLLAAVDDLELYLDGIEGGKKERRDWAPPLATHMLIEVNRTMGELDNVLKFSDQLLQKFPDSRYVPETYLVRASTFFDKGDAGKAKSVISNFAKVISDKALSQRWRLEADLGEVIYDAEVRGQARRDKLAAVSSAAGSAYPTVRNRADVAEAESFIQDKKYNDAEQILTRVVKEPNADAGTRAAAFAGLGDCLFQKASAMETGSDEQKATLKESLLSFLRVVINYKDQSRYVPRSLFYAGRCFDLMGGQEDNARTLYLRVVRNYPGSNWANEAKSFIKR